MTSTGVLVIGAGQAGLSASYWLTHYGIEHLIVDEGSEFGQSWQQRWDSLQMITPNWMNSLPGLAYPGDLDGFEPKAATVRYLRDYGRFIGAPVRWGARVEALHQGFVADTSSGQIHAPQVIVATGHYQLPRIPEMATSLPCYQLHTSQYRTPDQIPPGDVIVIGSGNSGVAIAIELSRAHRVTLACGANPRVPRRVTGAQLIETMGAIAAHQLQPDPAGPEADMMWWLNETGFYELTAATNLGHRLSLATSDAYCGPPLSEIAATYGIELTGRVNSPADLPTAQTVIWATGFRTDFSWIKAGDLGQVRGVTKVAGLYLLGLRFMHTASSSLLYGAGRDARHVVEHIVAARS